MRSLLLPVLVLSLLACVACSAGAAKTKAPAAAAPATGGGDTLARIRATIGSASCTDAGQCRTLPIGARPCGGPQSYLPYSTAGTDVAALLKLGEQFKAEQQAANKASGMQSDCRFMPDPGAVCRAGTCVLAAPSGAPSAI